MPPADALAEQQRLSARKLMQAETEMHLPEPVSALQPPPPPSQPPPPQLQSGYGGGASGGRAGAREQEERRVINAAMQRGASERRAGSGAATSRLPPAGPSSHLQPLRAMRRSTAGGAAATARDPHRVGGVPRAGSAPRARPGGGGSGASHEMETEAKADAAALKRANKLLGAEMRRRSIETDAEALGLKKIAGNLEAELKRLRVELARKDAELRRHERALDAHESAALFGGDGGGGLAGGGADQKSLVKSLKVQVTEHARSGARLGRAQCPCACSGHAWRLWLWAASLGTPTGRDCATGRPASASGARARRLQRRRFHRPSTLTRNTPPPLDRCASCRPSCAPSRRAWTR